jgi:hypothetical protein
MNPQTVVGAVVGTGAAQNIVIGFQPDFVILVDTTNNNLVDMWFRGMAAGTAINHSGAAPALRGSPNGMTAYVGTAAGNGEGFTIGAAESVNGATLRYFATRSGPGAN